MSSTQDTLSTGGEPEKTCPVCGEALTGKLHHHIRHECDEEAKKAFANPEVSSDE